MLVLLITFGLELVSSTSTTYNNAILDVDIRKAGNVHSLGFLISWTSSETRRLQLARALARPLTKIMILDEHRDMDV